MTGADYISYDPFFKDCMLRIADDIQLTNTWIFGIPFLQAYYSIFDQDKH